MTKFLKVSSIIFLSLATLICALFFTYLIITKDAKLNESKLIHPNQSIAIYDDEGNEVVNASVANKYPKRLYCVRRQKLLFTQRA